MHQLIKKIQNKDLKIGVIGLGYVGLPLAINFSSKGYRVIGFDIDKSRVNKVNKKINYIKNVDLKKGNNKIKAYLKFNLIKECDVIIITVPTPLKKNFKPDLSHIKNSMKNIIPYLRKYQLISLESTSYPGTTYDEIVKKIKNMKIGLDIFICYSPEREDPGNKYFKTKDIPKVISGYTKNCLKVGKSFYKVFFRSLVSVSSTQTAEFTKLLENIYRSVNIGLVNEMKIISHKMGVNIHEAIKAASTKPFGYRPFNPGPGMGGHCIPIDPFYMFWKAKKLGYVSKFIKEAGKINTMMPRWIISKVENILKKKDKKTKLNKILIIGTAYKKNIDDDRESPAYPIMSGLKKKGYMVHYYDPYIKVIKKDNPYSNLKNLKSIKFNTQNLKNFDVTIIITDHNNINYSKILKNSKLIFDCRNKLKLNSKKNNSKIIQV